MNYDGWCRLGERLGLMGHDLERFIKEKEEEHIAREERAQRREDERRQQEMQFQLRMREQELEIERLRAGRGNSDTSSGKALRPKLPKFDETQDDMDAFIERFERFAQSQQWSEDTWAVSLSSLLTGKGLEVYTSMPPSEACNYKALKVAVLKRYQLTEEGFRSKFRTSKPDQGETVYQYAARIRRYFTRWTELAGVEDTFEALCDLLIREQYLTSCSPDLSMFLRERAPKSMEEVIRLAEQYTEAHGDSIYHSNMSADLQLRQNEELAIHTSRTPTKEAEERKKDKTCFICNRKGHIAKECRTLKSERTVSAACATVDEWKENGRLMLVNGDKLPIISASCFVEEFGELGGKRKTAGSDDTSAVYHIKDPTRASSSTVEEKDDRRMKSTYIR
jgi:hypothetical protein